MFCLIRRRNQQLRPVASKGAGGLPPAPVSTSAYGVPRMATTHDSAELSEGVSSLPDGRQACRRRGGSVRARTDAL